jgi:hypothetical protein
MSLIRAHASSSGVEIEVTAPGRGHVTFFPKTCCIQNSLWYISRSAARHWVGNLSKTINRQLFFVWLDNAFAFDSRPMTIAS